MGFIQYDPSRLPTGFNETELGVYYFDTFWGRWIQVDASAVDTTKHVIAFACEHFTEFVVQATQRTDLSPDQYQSMGYSPLRTYAEHGDLTVSPQSGTTSTTATDLSLNGIDGFNMTLSRRWDLNLAEDDARIDAISEIQPYLLNQGDYAYSMGNGWRLNIPYIKDANTEPMICLPNGVVIGFYSLMYPTSMTSPVTTIDATHRSLTLIGHGSSEFQLIVYQSKTTFQSSYTGYPGSTTDHTWAPDSTRLYVYVLKMADGTVYEMDANGRTITITDPTGRHSISIVYNDNSPQIAYMQDDLHRRFTFTYSSPRHGVAYSDSNLPPIPEINCRGFRK